MAGVDENENQPPAATTEGAPPADPKPAESASSSTAPDATAAPAAPSAGAPAIAEPELKEPKLAAVDTGKRIDPSLLGGGTIRRGEKPGASQGPRRAEHRRDERPRGGKREGPEIFRKGRPLDEDERKALEARAGADASPGEAAAEGAAPAADGASGADVRPLQPRGEPRGERGPPRGDRGGERGPRRDGPRGDRGGRGPRRDGGGGGDRGPRREGERDERPRGPNNPRIDFSDMQPIVVKRDEDVGDFAAMLAETGPIDRVDVRVGDRVKARCVHLGTDTAFFELSRTQEAQAPLAEFLDDDGNVTLEPGDKIDAFVVGLSDGILLSTKLGKDQIDVTMLEQARASGIPIQGTVTSVNKGGIEVQISGNARGFCPLGQIDAGFVDDPQALVGKTLSFLVREVKENGRNVLLSRRALVEREKKEKAEQTLRTIAVGKQIQGTVSRLVAFGAFVDIGGLDGLIPMSEMGWGHVKDASEVLKVGDVVTVDIIKIDYDTTKGGMPKIGLSLKSAQPDPFIANADKMQRGAVLVGKVRKLEQFGAFVELWPGVQGLVHISEIADRRIAHPRDVLKVDEQVQVRILDVDAAARRVSLSMKEAPVDFAAAVDNPASVDKRPRVGRGTMVEGVVDRIERYGVFVKLDPVDGRELGSALLPASESGTPRGADLGKVLPVGTRMQLVVIDVDERGRLKVSKTARDQAEERALVEQFGGGGGGAKAKGGGGGGLGTLGDLLKAKLQK